MARPRGHVLSSGHVDSVGEGRLPCADSKFIAGTARKVFVITETGVFPGTSMYLPKLPNCEKGVLETHVMATLGKYFKIVPTVKVPHGPEPMTRKEFGVDITRRKVLGWNTLYLFSPAWAGVTFGS